MNIITRFIIVAVLTGAVLAGCVSKTQESDVPNDLEIAHIVFTAGNIDIRQAQLALALSENPEIQRFAEGMVRDHTAINEETFALIYKLQLTPQDNRRSKWLARKGHLIRNELSVLRGDDFDERYAATEVEYHKFVTQAIEKALIPNVKNGELKELLTQAWQMIKGHEDQALALYQKAKSNQVAMRPSSHVPSF